ncbi:hypothetical protein TSAR_015189 [Trichomalopsis sarcophagae]|uniref:Uncharacterized protein n=1 Tax=Trichomalopsis sarcophagae TaxID=543379 RepID=A0A232F8F8_9HYME|nr:hypothetical protein TSAR_015189 [Trichomalopsis sarcophagae]
MHRKAFVIRNEETTINQNDFKEREGEKEDTDERLYTSAFDEEGKKVTVPATNARAAGIYYIDCILRSMRQCATRQKNHVYITHIIAFRFVIQFHSCLIKSLPFSAIIITAALVFPLVTLGITDASITRSPLTPITLNFGSTTEVSSFTGPILQSFRICELSGESQSLDHDFRISRIRQEVQPNDRLTSNGIGFVQLHVASTLRRQHQR